MSVQNYEVEFNPLQWVYGYQVSNDATTPNTKLDVAAGLAFDSNAVYELNSSSSFVINAAVVGANGIDAGSLAASSMYAVYIIGDSRNYEPVAAILSLASNSAPKMPFGYDSYRLVGYAATDSMSHFLLMYQYGNGNLRYFYYDAPQVTAVTAGTSSSYAAVDLSASVPANKNMPAMINYIFTNNAASDTLKLQPVGGTGDMITVVGQVAGVVINGIAVIPVGIASSKAEINYKVSAGSVAIDVSGFIFAV